METIDRRIQNLERQVDRAQQGNRALAFALATVVCVAGAQVAQPQAKSSKDTGSQARDAQASPQALEANQLVLLDPHGRPRLKMAVTAEGPSISLLDEHGHSRLELKQTSNASGMTLLGADEAQIASLEIEHASDRAELEIKSKRSKTRTLTTGDAFAVWDSADNARLQLALINGNFPLFAMSQPGQRGPSSIEMTAGNDGSRAFKIHDRAGHPVLSVAATQDGATHVDLRHPDRKQSLQVSTGSAEQAGPQIAFFAAAEENGNGVLPRLQLGLKTDHQPYIRIADADGKTLHTAP